MIQSLSDACAASVGYSTSSLASAIGGPRLSILIFHRVLRHADLLFPEEVEARRFDRLMALVARTFRVLPLDLAVAQLTQRNLPSRALSITFDDGYADNHDVALPILVRHGLTATFFVATGFLDGGRMWNDTVIECLRRTLAPKLDLYEFGLAEMPTCSATERRVVIDLLLSIVKYKPPAERDLLLRLLHRLCGEPPLPSDLMMRGEQARALSSAGMGIGAHTVNHPILCSLTDLQAEREMSDSRACLEELIDLPVTTFAYPNGKPGRDYDERHVLMAKNLGFLAAVSTTTGVSRPGDDLWQLKRFTPWDPAPLRWHSRLVMHHVSA